MEKNLLSIKQYAQANGVTDAAVGQQLAAGRFPAEAVVILDGRKFILAGTPWPTRRKPGPKRPDMAAAVAASAGNMLSFTSVGA